MVLCVIVVLTSTHPQGTPSPHPPFRLFLQNVWTVGVLLGSAGFCWVQFGSAGERVTVVCVFLRVCSDAQLCGSVVPGLFPSWCLVGFCVSLSPHSAVMFYVVSVLWFICGFLVGVVSSFFVFCGVLFPFCCVYGCCI